MKTTSVKTVAEPTSRWQKGWSLRTVDACRLLALALTVCSCKPARPPSPVPIVALVGSAEVLTPTTAGPPSLLKPRVHLDHHGIGPLRLGESFPAQLFSADLAKHYRATMYADAQPLEGFLFEEPAVLAVVSGGPFHDVGMASPGDPIPATMPAEAAQRARDGKLLVTMLVVTAPTVTTDRHIRVGSTYAAVLAAYPKIKTVMMPGMWEEPSCIAEEGNLVFFFARCTRGTRGFVPDEPVIRIVVWRLRDE